MIAKGFFAQDHAPGRREQSTMTIVLRLLFVVAARGVPVRRWRRMPIRPIRRRPARSIPRRCRRSPIRIRRRRRPRNCSPASRCRFPGPARSIGCYARRLPRRRRPAADRRARPGRSCGCRAIAIGAIRTSSISSSGSAKLAKKVGWNGLLVGDMSQPRGGPMITGHASHQVGLDADIWFTPMPDHVLTREEREFDSGGQYGRAGSPRRRSEGVDAYAHRTHPHGCGGSRGDAHLRQCRDQEGDVPRSRIGSRLAVQGAAVVGPCRALSRPHRLPGRQLRSASRSRRCRRATAAVTRSIIGSRNRRCIRRRRWSRQSRNRG